jgi:hypothetical protein
MPESSDLSLMTDKVGKGWFSMLCHGSELIGSGIMSFRRRGGIARSVVGVVVSVYGHHEAFLFRPGDRGSIAGTGPPVDGSCGCHAASPIKNPPAGSLQGMDDHLSQSSGAGRRYGFRRWGLDAAGSGFYIPITLSGSAKQRGVVAQQRRHLLLDMNWGSSHIRFS